MRGLGVTSIFTKEDDQRLDGLWEAPANGLSLPSVSAIADNILLFDFFKLRSKIYRTVLAFKVRNSRTDDELRLFTITDRGLVVDDNAARAEAVFAEALGRPEAAFLSGAATRNPRRRGT